MMSKSKICRLCKKVFYKRLREGRIHWFNRKYCSQRCYHTDKIKPKKFKYCAFCGKVIYKDMDWSYKDWNKRQFCNKKCFNEFYKSEWVECICLNCNKIFKVRKQQFERGRGKYCSKKCYTESITIYPKSPVERLIYRFRQLDEYKKWHMDCLRRDWFKCRICKSKKNLEVHHRIPFRKLLIEFLKEYNQFSPLEDRETLIRLAFNYKLFWNIDNGITYCRKHHRSVEMKLRIRNKEKINVK